MKKPKLRFRVVGGTKEEPRIYFLVPNLSMAIRIAQETSKAKREALEIHVLTDNGWTKRYNFSAH